MSKQILVKGTVLCKQIRCGTVWFRTGSMWDGSCANISLKTNLIFKVQTQVSEEEFIWCKLAHLVTGFLTTGRKWLWHLVVKVHCNASSNRLCYQETYKRKNVLLWMRQWKNNMRLILSGCDMRCNTRHWMHYHYNIHLEGSCWSKVCGVLTSCRCCL